MEISLQQFNQKYSFTVKKKAPAARGGLEYDITSNGDDLKEVIQDAKTMVMEAEQMTAQPAVPNG